MSSECLHQPMKYYSACEAPPVLVCAAHLPNHLHHSPQPIFQELSQPDRDLALQVYQCFQAATQSSIDKVLRETSITIQGLLEQVRYRRAAGLNLLSQIAKESRNKANELVSIIKLSWDTHSAPLFQDTSLAKWFTETIESEELRSSFTAELQSQYGFKTAEDTREYTCTCFQ